MIAERAVHTTKPELEKGPISKGAMPAKI